MNTNKKILSMGIILLIAGVVAASLSFIGSTLLQYIFVASALAVGALGSVIGRNANVVFTRTGYYPFTGLVLIGLSTIVVIWDISQISLVNVLGFALLFLGMIEFAYALQILNHESIIPWKVVGLKLNLSATAALGGASMLTKAGFDGYMALLFLGLLFVTVGLTFIQFSRIAKDADSSWVN